ncbi:MAG: hypothetical protein K2J77_02505 [Oscillospiraceae bacterium]|nr:hypothetical protein [Oscillospiraceae bacterium]
MINKYEFKRDIYYQVLNAPDERAVVFLYGARNTGKTICLKQLADFLPDAEYYDFKSMEMLECFSLAHRIEDCVKAREPRTFLIDNPAYLVQCDSVIEGLEYAFDELFDLDENALGGTRVVFAGGPPKAMRYWANKYFGDFAWQIVSDFPDYHEWLRFYGAADTPENHERFLSGENGLNADFISFDGFLNGCLEESRVADSNAMNIIFGNESDLLDARTLKAILLAVLAEELDEKLVKNAAVSEYLNVFAALPPETRKQGHDFLGQWGLITLPNPRVSHPFIRAKLFEQI